MNGIISASLSPNAEFEDVALAFRLLFSPWSWKRGASVGKVEAWFRHYFGTNCALTFNSGRSAQLAILKVFGIGEGDEVIVQAFTCVAVPNSVRWTGAAPVYADIDSSYNIDPTDLEKKITKKTKAVIVQHTFGIPADIESILPIARKHNLLVIEDCAHSLGATAQNKKVGTFGDAAFFSFGRDKIISSVFGGLAIINEKHKAQSAKLKIYHKKLNTPPFGWIFQQIFHPVAFSVILPWYRVGIGKALLVAFQKMRLLSFPVYPEEKKGGQPADFPAKYPNALAQLLLLQLKKLERYNALRQKAALVYAGEDTVAGAVYLRFPVKKHDPSRVVGNAKKQGVLLGNWYHNVIDPAGVEFAKVGYAPGSCPRAEEAAKYVINLPTRISRKDAQRVMRSL